MRVVLDCDIIVSAARIEGTCRAVFDTVARRHDIVLSEPILTDGRRTAQARDVSQ